jgi:hypothetical protein
MATPVEKAKAYTVLKITELTRLAEGEGIEKYYRHQIKTAGGVMLNVDIDEKDFTPKKADPILLAAAQNADAILKL